MESTRFQEKLQDLLEDQGRSTVDFVRVTVEKETQIKHYKTREDKEIDKVIELENKVKVLDNIVYKIGQSVQTMNMLNNKCRTSFAKPEFLKKAQRANPRLYDIGCYNDNLALMLAPESDEFLLIVDVDFVVDVVTKGTQLSRDDRVNSKMKIETLNYDAIHVIVIITMVVIRYGAVGFDVITTATAAKEEKHVCLLGCSCHVIGIITAGSSKSCVYVVIWV
nr:hypothetical protein [Tanacetum cinerariifolium]